MISHGILAEWNARNYLIVGNSFQMVLYLFFLLLKAPLLETQWENLEYIFEI